WPEAGDALIVALRTDKNECVRWEAAMALGSGCCCKKETVEALNISASGSDKDGNPSENSERVKAAALFSLQKCLACISMAPPVPVEVGPEPIPPPEGETPRKTKPEGERPPAAIGALNRSLPPYYKRLHKVPMTEVLDNARRTAEQGGVAQKVALSHAGGRSLSEIIMNSPARSAVAASNVNPAAAATASRKAESPVQQSMYAPAAATKRETQTLWQTPRMPADSQPAQRIQ